MTEILEKIYSSFVNLDADGMASCYHDEATFEDPAFGKLNSNQVKAMWNMLLGTQNGDSFKVSYSNIKASENNGSAQWEAHYTFSKTGRKVHNKVTASFEFKDGLIYSHKDDFNLYTWSKQALGAAGFLIGWTSFFKMKLQSQTASLLRTHMKIK